MKYSNFKLTEVIGKSPVDWKFKATVDVTSGLFRKKTETKEIAKDYAGSWFFLDDGWFCPLEVGNLARAYAGRRGKDLEHIDPNSDA